MPHPQCPIANHPLPPQNQPPEANHLPRPQNQPPPNHLQIKYLQPNPYNPDHQVNERESGRKGGPVASHKLLTFKYLQSIFQSILDWCDMVQHSIAGSKQCFSLNTLSRLTFRSLELSGITIKPTISGVQTLPRHYKRGFPARPDITTRRTVQHGTTTRAARIRA